MLSNLATSQNFRSSAPMKPSRNLLLDLHIMPRPGEKIFPGRPWLMAGLITLVIMFALSYFCFK
ncbi:MAG: hypothetical protein NTX66_03285 [Candidatus Falkowbacteria bacterium]|nr:hypothetical protein [Candidatus Falkowbacteria bacterium]